MKLHLGSHKASENVKILYEPTRVQIATVRGPWVPKRKMTMAVSATQASDGGLSSNSSLLGPSLNVGGGSSLGSLSSSETESVSLDDVALESGVGVDYTALRDYLKEGEWRKAEDETRAKLIEAAGPDAQKRGWVYWSEVKSIPDADMRTLDTLWAAASGGKFGYRKQRELWVQSKRMWTKFFQKIKWVQGENNVYLKWPTEFIYSQDAVPGHLPLTNCLRGTRLFEAIMEHPAIAGAKKDASSAENTPSWLK